MGQYKVYEIKQSIFIRIPIIILIWLEPEGIARILSIFLRHLPS